MNGHNLDRKVKPLQRNQSLLQVEAAPGKKLLMKDSKLEKREKKSYENVCHFYKNGHCRFEKDCRRDHPKFHFPCNLNAFDNHSFHQTPADISFQI